MIEQIQYLASWTRYRLQNRLGQRGAEMVEYAVVLACIAAVGVYFYARETGDRYDQANYASTNHGGANGVMWNIMSKFAKIIKGIKE